jgi:hypothetical protein
MYIVESLFASGYNLKKCYKIINMGKNTKKLRKQKAKKKLTPGQLWFRSLSDADKKVYQEQKIAERMLKQAIERDRD